MPLLFIGTGLILILTGLNGSTSQLYELVKGDFAGENNYVYWMLSILALGALGYIPQLKNISRLFVILVVIVLLLDNKGFFAQFQAFINSTSTASGTASNTNSSTTGGAAK